MPILRITAQWSGFRGAPGYSNFFFQGQSADEEDALAHAQAVQAFFTSASRWMPSGLSISIQPIASNVDETNGQTVGEVDFEPPASVSGGSEATYSAASGAVVNWNTTAYRNGRRVRGRTFLVPLASDAYDAQGDLNAAVINDIRDGAQALIANPGPVPMVVWSRPVNGAGGQIAPVTSASVPDLGAVLRSRRD